MKKLMMMLAVVAMAAAAQAAAMNWRSGKIYLPGEGGAFSTSGAPAGSVLGSLYLVDEATYNTFAAGLTADQAAGMTAIYNAAQAGTLGAVAATKSSTALGNKADITDPNTYGIGNSAYGVVLYSYNDGTTDWYLANAATYSWEADVSEQIANLASKVGGLSSGDTITGWQTAAAVPEPASVGLLMLGLCALGLKRKRA